MHCAVHSSGAPSLIAQGQQERYDIFGLLGGQDRLAAPGMAHTSEPLHPVICWHDRVWFEAGGVDETHPQLALGPTRTGPREIRRERPLEFLFCNRAGVTEQTGAQPTIN